MNPEEMAPSAEKTECLNVDKKELERALYVLKNERECVSRDCKHECETCDLVLDMDWVKSAYDEIIRVVEYLLNPKGGTVHVHA